MKTVLVSAVALIDRDGRVREIHHGYRPGVEAKYLDRVRTLLREE